MNLPDLAHAVATLARTTGQYIAQERERFDPARIEHKGLNDLVSYVDKTAEERVIEGLRGLLPGADFITEEGTLSQSDGQTDPGPGTYWIIDPLDGTTNFIHGLPMYAVSIGLLQDGEITLGCVYEPNRDETYLAWKGGGAFLNGAPLRVAQRTTLEGSLQATGFPYSLFDQMDAYLASINELMRRTHGLRRMGSAAIDMAYVAAGRFDGFFEYNLKAWDIAAGIILVKEAGGHVTDFSGGKNYLFGRQIVAGGNSQPELQALLAKHFN